MIITAPSSGTLRQQARQHPEPVLGPDPQIQEGQVARSETLVNLGNLMREQVQPDDAPRLADDPGKAGIRIRQRGCFGIDFDIVCDVVFAKVPWLESSPQELMEQLPDSASCP